jgi:hypothetical protein
MNVSPDDDFPSLIDALLHFYPLSRSPPQQPPFTRTAHVSFAPVAPYNTTYHTSSAPSRFTSRQQPSLTTPKIRSSPQRKATGAVANMDNSSPQSIPGKNKLSASPSRHRNHNVLSPLQTFSPLQPVSNLPKSSLASDAGSVGGRSRAPSLTRSLSRKQSLYANAAKWSQGHDYDDENITNPASLFSRLTLVKAPSEASAMLKK